MYFISQSSQYEYIMKRHGVLFFVVLLFVLFGIVAHCYVPEFFSPQSLTMTIGQPLTIMQTHKYKITQVPDIFSEAWDSWKTQTDCAYVYFDDADGRQYLLNNLGQEYVDTYDAIAPGAFKADFFRYCWLYKEGGVYADFDSVALVQIHDWLKDYPDVDVVLARDDPSDRTALYQAFVFCRRPRNKLFKTCIDMIMRNVRDAHDGKWFSWSDFTGPKLVYNAFCSLEPHRTGSVLPAALDADTDGTFDTSFGKMFLLSWALPTKELVDNRERRIVRHCCATCRVEDDHYRHFKSSDYVMHNPS